MDILAAWGGIRPYRDLPLPGLVDEPVADFGAASARLGVWRGCAGSGFFSGRGLDIAARLHRIDECLPGESCLGI